MNEYNFELNNGMSECTKPIMNKFLTNLHHSEENEYLLADISHSFIIIVVEIFMYYVQHYIPGTLLADFFIIL